jgi:thiol:disulfide interchange protein DsbA
MKRRDFSLSAGTALTIAGMNLSLAQAQTAATSNRNFQAGTDFLPLPKPAPVDAPAGKIEVIEFFWYSCPHCNAFEPMLSEWTKQLPKDVSFRRIPVSFRPDFAPQQRLFFALEAMGLVEKLQSKVFSAIHAERQRLDQPQAIFEWVAKQGVDKVKFQEQYNSFSAAGKLSRAGQLQDAYKVEGVPALGVAGRFYTDGTLTKTMDRALQVVDYLVGEVRKGR